MSFGIRNDEPAIEDALDRDKIALALANAVQICDTPLVVGLYGSWGSGKTSLMKLVQRHLDRTDNCVTVWFDAWQHQFDENPAVALLHTMVEEAGLGEEGRKLLYAIAGALGNAALKAMTLMSAATDFRKFEEKYEQERFLVREKQVRLRQHFEELLGKVTNNGEIRLVFFIDDLDRCVSEHILKTLEALKLFLNMKGCVYVLGVDREALERSIRHRYGDEDVSEAQYLDKIVQVPFTIPPVTADSTTGFVRSLLTPKLHDIAEDIVAGLGTNPRQIKRFVNSFILNDELAKQTFDSADYDAKILVALLVVQYQRPAFYKEIVDDRDVLLAPSDANAHLFADPAVLRLSGVIKGDPSGLDGYIHLSQVAGVRPTEFDVRVTQVGEFKINLVKVVREHNNISLKEAKDLVEAGPPILAGAGLSREAAEDLLEKVLGTGSRAELV
ncbi:ribosomal protein L7/L12 [Actinokineospora iranica]|uniref:Ribosomal protein L7/L12 C-terminal domain-containing protein n=1 Tax=Actinokineospora iranica TaxID=1271860 RepID=A0A1G6R3E8_9PSEU|nr:ribosomal protein L7/L12 [Actinokineospora iranica]SDC98436.1 Ribosomal protein L7/L12 C-terminal domain-containing protein [Actinokineospora iranica]